MPQHDRIQLAFGISVRRHREDAGLSQEKLAEQADLDRTYISDIERGSRNPGIKNVVRLAKALRTTASELLAGVDQ